MSETNKHVYFFGKNSTEGGADRKNLLGGKGANLAEMTHLGIPVPPGFTITTEVCSFYNQNQKQYPPTLIEQVDEGLKKIEAEMKCTFGSAENPLLLSVRSGARVSMPGMMDTVLNLGLNSQTLKALIQKTQNPRFVWDSYRRFIQMYSNVVMGMESHFLEEILDQQKKKFQVDLDSQLTEKHLQDLVDLYRAEIIKRTGSVFPEDPKEQLWAGIQAVLDSWNVERAKVYRKLHDIPESWGTAVNLVAMVFGNRGENSGTGVAFTRDPSTGEKVFYGEFLKNAQGEDVVAGIRTPQNIDQLQREFPDSYGELEEIYQKLEQHYRDMMDIEFTIEEGKLWMLQCRVGKRTSFASFRIASEMVTEGLITKEEAILRLDAEQLNQLLRPIFDSKAKEQALKEDRFLAKGLNAGPGAASGRVVFSAQEAVQWKKRGESVILVRIETSPEDIAGMNASEGILTARGGMTSHAALVARQMGKVCVAGCENLEIDYVKKEMRVHKKTKLIREGDFLSLDGSTGEVIEGKIQTLPSEVVQVLLSKTLNSASSSIYQVYDRIMIWVDEIRKLRVRTNADQPDQCETALAFGAEGIGLCRTEHMFFEEGRIDWIRRMILSDSLEERERALSELLPIQKEDFKGIFRVMNGFPVTIRLLDPPLHEFLPHDEEEIQTLARQMGKPMEQVQNRVHGLKEFNPMLGHRGCRLGILYPEITRMQAQAILEASVEVAKQGIRVEPEIMVPLVSDAKELAMQKELIDRVAKEVFDRYSFSVSYLVGTMIELPRAALTADQIAEFAQFFSFGTNDLTQSTYGLSRDDAGKFLPFYIDQEIYPYDPFAVLDEVGVGQLVEIGVEKGRGKKSTLKIGICGEHGGEPRSVEFCHRKKLDYVSCSPYRVPIARLASAQAVLRERQN